METLQQIEPISISKSILREVHTLRGANKYSGLLIVLFNYLLIAFSVMICVQFSYWFYPISLIIIGSVQRVFANLLHEASHGLLSSNKRLNQILGTYFTSFLICHLLIPYKQTHLRGHHPYCGDEEKDPDYNFQIACGLYDTKEGYRMFFIKNIVLSIIGYRTIEYIRYIYRDRIFFDTSQLSEERTRKFRRERLQFFITWAVVFATVILSGVLLEFFLFWIIPLFTSYVTIGWLAEMAEHYPLPESEKSELLLTRNRHGNMIENFIFGRHGDRYHLVHHLCPSIPCYKLREAHEVLRKDTNYREWDNIWGGIFSKGKPGTETLLSYTKKYRKWEGGEPGMSFGLHMLGEYRGLVNKGGLR
ncbi:fatty acid desaturase family protein [Fulvivirga ulvae]|uniref:fatty acid desaturase family protein n=1 Tax=Fulvivirga ulvae TaxID=2904245 RepID=UPI001F1CC327|nr:fatty acid desaturase family protein [Fulvivirga ulvae]UII33618.1 fatty acid desaturase family protein [Fulvivirga ulvae]